MTGEDHQTSGESTEDGVADRLRFECPIEEKEQPRHPRGSLHDARMRVVGDHESAESVTEAREDCGGTLPNQAEREQIRAEARPDGSQAVLHVQNARSDADPEK